MVGGGVKGGFSYGVIDEFGYEVVDDWCYIYDWYVMILYFLGMDYIKLIYCYVG